MSYIDSSSASSELSSDKRRKVKARAAKPQKMVDIVQFPDPKELDSDFSSPQKISTDEVVSSGSSSESRKALQSSDAEVDLDSEGELDQEFNPYYENLATYGEEHILKAAQNLLKTLRKNVGSKQWAGQKFVELKDSKRKNTGEYIEVGQMFEPVPLKKFPQVDESEVIEAILSVVRDCFFDPPSKKVTKPKHRIIKKKKSEKSLKRSLSDAEESDPKRQSTSSE